MIRKIKIGRAKNPSALSLLSYKFDAHQLTAGGVDFCEQGNRERLEIFNEKKGKDYETSIFKERGRNFIFSGRERKQLK